ncbi:hypothetical protein HRI_001525400 [Hibiscus trionum]|uniref:Uncharacterized protein n=1 Tax=Hibiscus trionum TaxID=183268 RepID=A0A9W7LWH6_HIBTR|nr:hypothetical protein HRI_001525400 [Hibiscus trionum]
MDAIFMSSSSPQKSVSSPNKQLKNNTLRRYNSGANFISNQNENLAYNASIIHGGGSCGGGFLFAPPPYHSFSYNPSPPLLNPLSYQNYQQQPQWQPPLLPLPLPNKPLHTSLPSRTLSLSSSPSNAKHKRNKDPKKSKSKQLAGKSVEEPKKLQLKPADVATKTFVMAAEKGFTFRPVPNATPKVGKDLESFTSFIFTLSPPPSSLPLPSFSLRPKLSCNAEAASGDDGGATHNLRRVLRLP